MAERMRVGVVGCGLMAQVMHLPIAIAAAEAGKQPLCLSVAEGRESLAAAARIGSRLAAAGTRP